MPKSESLFGSVSFVYFFCGYHLCAPECVQQLFDQQSTPTLPGFQRIAAVRARVRARLE